MQRNYSAQMLRTAIERHKTAIHRGDASAPIKRAIEDKLVGPGISVFDFGCGHGEDIKQLTSQGIECDGWDPVFQPDRARRPADAVNLGYVINVIEDPEERARTLLDAWALCRKLLIVSAQILVPGRGKQQVEFGDGVLTRRNTFQKFFTQGELREYIQSKLGIEPVPATLGIYYAFKDEELREAFLANRYRRRPSGPKKPKSEIRFEQSRELLESLIEVVEELGRLPDPDEFENTASVIAEFGSLKRAFGVVRRVTGEERWEAARKQRTDDLLVYLALARFRQRPPISKLPASLQRDIREFFGTYKQACSLADELLFRAGDPTAIDEACVRSPIGKILPTALYVHHTAVESLTPLLRVYEGCGRGFLGQIDGANLIKLHRFTGKISYLVYRDFEDDPHPILSRSVKLNMRTQQLDCYDYETIENPPILHRKETFLEPTHPLHSKFARLTKQEEDRGLLTETESIGTLQGWQTRLSEMGFKLRGHRLIRESTKAGD